MTLVDIGDENELKCIYELNNNNCEYLGHSYFKLRISFKFQRGLCSMISFGLAALPLIAIFITNTVPVATNSTGMTQIGLAFCLKLWKTASKIKSRRLAGQPDFFQGGEYCVTAALKSGTPYAVGKGMLGDLGCSVGKKVLCEVKHFIFSFTSFHFSSSLLQGSGLGPCTQVACPDNNCIPDVRIAFDVVNMLHDRRIFRVLKSTIQKLGLVCFQRSRNPFFCNNFA
jgi:hypothetical protein